jgi:secondary thiamine-phosphate synthase enzyme
MAMIVNQSIEIHTKGHTDIINITAQVRERLVHSGLKGGIVTLFVAGSTAGIMIIEDESGLIADFQEIWEDIVPSTESYHHDKKWNDANGYAHLRASIMGPSLVIPFKDGQLMLGAWQQIVAVDFDNRPRQRTVAVQIMGE